VSRAVAGSSPVVLPGSVAQRRLPLAVNQVSHTQVRVLPGSPTSFPDSGRSKDHVVARLIVAHEAFAASACVFAPGSVGGVTGAAVQVG
jgi:hypothetical protein